MNRRVVMTILADLDKRNQTMPVGITENLIKELAPSRVAEPAVSPESGGLSSVTLPSIKHASAEGKQR